MPKVFNEKESAVHTALGTHTWVLLNRLTGKSTNYAICKDCRLVIYKGIVGWRYSRNKRIMALANSTLDIRIRNKEKNHGKL